MAVQYDPIAKDESLNTTETPSRNMADVLAQGLAALASAMPATELENLSDVTISAPSNGQTLKYNSVTQKWENANVAAKRIETDTQTSSNGGVTSTLLYQGVVDIRAYNATDGNYVNAVWRPTGGGNIRVTLLADTMDRIADGKTINLTVTYLD